MRGLLLGCTLLFSLLHSSLTLAHEIRPGYLSVMELESSQNEAGVNTAASKQRFSVLWKQPVKDGNVVKLELVFPQSCQFQFNHDSTIQRGFRTQTANLICPKGDLAAGTIRVEGLDASLMDVLLKIQWLNAEAQQQILNSAKIELKLNTASSHDRWSYGYLGFEHILEGVDHLLFLLALLLLINKPMLLLKVITSFTLAHSITLALASLGFVNVPSGPVEACIALSIILMASEALLAQKGKLQAAGFSRRPWLMAGLFGLLHGLGFAGALSEIGLPEGDIPLALLLFNVGIEAGQLLFISACLCILVSLKYLQRRLSNGDVIAFNSYRASAYLVGGMASFWFVERSLKLIL